MSRLIDKVKSLEAKNAKSVSKQDVWDCFTESEQAELREAAKIFNIRFVRGEISPQYSGPGSWAGWSTANPRLSHVNNVRGRYRDTRKPPKGIGGSAVDKSAKRPLSERYAQRWRDSTRALRPGETDD